MSASAGKEPAKRTSLDPCLGRASVGDHSPRTVRPPSIISKPTAEGAREQAIASAGNRRAPPPATGGGFERALRAFSGQQRLFFSDRRAPCARIRAPQLNVRPGGGLDRLRLGPPARTSTCRFSRPERPAPSRPPREPHDTKTAKTPLRPIPARDERPASFTSRPPDGLLRCRPPPHHGPFHEMARLRAPRSGAARFIYHSAGGRNSWASCRAPRKPRAPRTSAAWFFAPPLRPQEPRCAPDPLRGRAARERCGSGRPSRRLRATETGLTSAHNARGGRPFLPLRIIIKTQPVRAVSSSVNRTPSSVSSALTLPLEAARPAQNCLTGRFGRQSELIGPPV